jgi:hypothetical protein
MGASFGIFNTRTLAALLGDKSRFVAFDLAEVIRLDFIITYC